MGVEIRQEVPDTVEAIQPDVAPIPVSRRRIDVLWGMAWMTLTGRGDTTGRPYMSTKTATGVLFGHEIEKPGVEQ